jgi:RNA-directed DNA polymerase
MEEVVERGNMRAALRQVRAHQGSPGLDGLQVDELPEVLKTPWPGLKDQRLTGTSQPQGITRVALPQPGRHEPRKLGRPCGIDRLSQHAMLHVLQGRWDPTFCAVRSGFGPGRSAPQAVTQAQASIEQGDSDVVDRDLAKVFDRGCHDRLLSRLAERLPDKRRLQLIRAARHAGIVADGLITFPTAGPPQGSPLSPCLSNGV